MVSEWWMVKWEDDEGSLSGLILGRSAYVRTVKLPLGLIMIPVQIG